MPSCTKFLIPGLLASTVLLPALAQAAPAPATPAPTGASASDAAGEPGVNADIIVTAQRRDESLSKTPVSVAVISAGQLAKAQIVTEQDLRIVTPGLTIRTGIDSNQENYSLRGQSQDPFSNTQPGVLPYINEVQIGGEGGSSAFYDLQSVQVLKGPQGTLFGRSATGGAVLFTTAKPTDTFGGYLSGSYGNYNAQKVEGAINVPLIGDKLMARVAGIYDKRDGMQYNLFNNQHVGGHKRWGGRFSLTANIDKVHNELVVDYLKSDSQSTVSVISGLTPFTGVGSPYIPAELLYSGTSTPVATMTGICTLQAAVGFPGCGTAGVNPAVAGFYNNYFADPKHPTEGMRAFLNEQSARGPYVVDTNGPNTYKGRDIIVTNSTTIDLGNETKIKNIFGYTHLKQHTASDADGTPYALAASDFGVNGGDDSTTRQVSEELQLVGKTMSDHLDYVVGGYFANDRTANPTREYYFDIFFGGQHSVNDFTTTSRTFAGYGQATYHFGASGLAATAGLRYTSEKVSIQTLPDDTNRIALGNPAPAGYSYDQSQQNNKLSWTFGLQDQVNSDLMFYAASRRAYKSGGYNGVLAPKIGNASNAGNAYDAERVTDVEVGSKYKGRVGDVAVRAAIALFYMWNKDAQRVAYTLVAGNPATLTVNVPKGHVDGIESDFTVQPSRWFSFGFSANYLNAQFASDPVLVNGLTQVFNRVPDAPKFTGTVYADVTVPVRDNVAVSLHGDVYGQTKTYDSERYEDGPGTTLPGYSLVNFRLGLQDDKAGWSLTANLKNAFDKVFFVGGLPVGEIYQVNTLAPGDRRTVTVEARFKF